MSFSWDKSQTVAGPLCSSNQSTQPSLSKLLPSHLQPLMVSLCFSPNNGKRKEEGLFERVINLLFDREGMPYRHHGNHSDIVAG